VGSGKDGEVVETRETREVREDEGIVCNDEEECSKMLSQMKLLC